MINTVMNVALLVIFVALCTFICLAMRKYSYVIQSFIMIFLAILAIAIDELLLYFFKGFFIRQWYYSSSYNWKTGYGESIVVPFMFIGAIIYALVQVITFRIKRK